MTPKTVHKSAWAIARRQHGVITREQLLALGFSTDAIRHRLADGRLHPTWRGVYAVGRPELTREGVWMAAALTCKGALSGSAAAALWQIRPDNGRIEVTVPKGRRSERPGIVVHRRQAETTTRHGIPVTSLLQTFVDISTTLTDDHLEAAINEADKRDLIAPDKLRAALDGRRGAAKLRRLLDRRTFVLTDSALERHFRPIARRAGLPQPQTRTRVNGFKVDFYWPDLGLVVETDGLRYHRTAAQQTTDRVRDQAHTAAGLTPLRFTHAQVAYEPDHVRATLAAVAARLG
jgi:very-short-patch-repair endonuclease